jgi:prephenate dehydrogenase (NADP+)
MSNTEAISRVEEWKSSRLIGIIGLGDMGRFYARRFTEAGWK